MGLLVSVEGGDFVGKTTFVVPFLSHILTTVGVNVQTSREPGGSPEGERLRDKIFKKKAQGADDHKLAILFNKARKIHLETVIKPFLGEDRGRDGVMIIDRYLDSTRVYQGLEEGVPMDVLFSLEKEYVGDWFPDLTIVLYIQPARFDTIVASRIKRAKSRKTGKHQVTSWDIQTLTKHRKRQELYLSLPKLSRERGEKRKFLLVECTQEPISVIKKCVLSLKKFLFDPDKHITTTANSTKEIVDALEKLQNTKKFRALTDMWRLQERQIDL